MSKECFHPAARKMQNAGYPQKKRGAIRKTLPFSPPNRNDRTLPAIKRGKKERGARFGRMTKELDETHRGLRFLGATPADA